jgi:hypothetical protein
MKGQRSDVRGAKKLERQWYRRMEQLRKKAAKREKEQQHEYAVISRNGTGADRRF